jgi:hypothetical protein
MFNTMDDLVDINQQKPILIAQLFVHISVHTYSSVPNRRVGQNKRVGGINVQGEIRPCRGEFFLKINKRACTSIRYTKVCNNNIAG